MALPKFMLIPPQPLDRYRALLGDEEFVEIERIAARARHEFSGHAIWHVSSTARGGGVAELLHSLLPYVRGAGIDTRWVVLRDGSDFFRITKRLHNRLHGSAGDGGALGVDERRDYEATLAVNGAHLARLIQPGDVVYLHDPQSAGLVPMLKELGVKVIWRCHVGIDEPNALAREAWDFLRPYVEAADACVFSRRKYVWEGLDEERVWLMAPCIDAFCPKNQDLEPAAVAAILAVAGLEESLADGTAPVYVRGDGSPGRVDRRAELLQEAPLPADARVVAQVSRWDRLKDPIGLLRCFERHLVDPRVHLVMAAPSAHAVADDPEGEAVYGSLARGWRDLPEDKRRRVHLASLPMNDLDENAAMVNALQRRADVIVQKSIAEGFGLTVAEGMWKGKAVVGSRVGGIQDQIVDGESGVLVDDPHDLGAFGDAIRGLIEDPARAARLGEAARQRVIDRFLGINRLAEYVELVASLMAPAQTMASRKAPTA
ncbi:MAG TPA: glycosyltransferase [Solirubrobacterales bacterium]